MLKLGAWSQASDRRGLVLIKMTCKAVIDITL